MTPATERTIELRMACGSRRSCSSDARDGVAAYEFGLIVVRSATPLISAAGRAILSRQLTVSGHFGVRASYDEHLARRAGRCGCR